MNEEHNKKFRYSQNVLWTSYDYSSFKLWLRTKGLNNSWALFCSWSTTITILIVRSGKSYWRGRLSTVYLLVQASLDQLLLILKVLFTFFTKQAILTRRSTVVSLPLQLVFPSKIILRCLVNTIDIESLQNRLLKVLLCARYLGWPSKGKLLLLFSFFFVAAAINSTNEANKAGGTCH